MARTPIGGEAERDEGGLRSMGLAVHMAVRHQSTKEATVNPFDGAHGGSKVAIRDGGEVAEKWGSGEGGPAGDRLG